VKTAKNALCGVFDYSLNYP